MLSTKIFLEVEKTSSFWTVMWICAPENEIESTHLWKKMKSLQFIPIHNSKAKMDKSMIWITKRCLSDYVQGVNRNGKGWILDETPLSLSHPLPNLGRGGVCTPIPILKQQLKSHPHPVLIRVWFFEETRLGIKELKY